jgi:glycosyltransferase involved in cell wall biosynthesis
MIHIPTPGDHYSAASGSAVMTVIYEYGRRHALEGGVTKLIVGCGTRHDYPVGECTEVPFSPLPDRNHKIVDALMGRIGMPRRFLERVYKPAVEVMSPTFEGAAIAHNAPVVIGAMKGASPRARTTLYCHNSLFGTYADSEMRRTLAPADVIVCVSTFLAEELKARLGNADGRVFGITNGVDTERFCPPDSKPDAVEPVILFIGRVVPEKGADLLVKAAVRLANGKRRFKVRIVGSSNFNANDPLTAYEQELRRTASQIPDHIEFIPFVDRNRVVEQYHRASIFCAPSNWDEPCSLTVPEAMACGLPTVAARRGGIPEVGGDAVLYFTPPNTDELTERLEYLIDNPDARVEWGARARVQADTISWHTQYQLLRKALFG